MIYILLPAFNESQGIKQVLQNISSQLSNQRHSIIVVNDGSTDNTLGILSELQSKFNLKIISHETNQGLGSAMKTGFQYVLPVITSNDVLIVMDADNTHPVDLIPKLIKTVERGKDIVIASRYAPGGKEIGLSNFRKVMSKTASVLLSLVFNVKNVTDYTSGYRAYSGKILRRAEESYGDNLVTEPGFTCMTEILIKLSKIGAQVAEDPLMLRYDFKKGPSKIKVIATILDYLRLIFKLKFSKI